MKNMLIDYMGKGFLENIIALFKTDDTLYELIPEMLSDENMRVRLGTAALVEDLLNSNREDIRKVVPGIAALLRHRDPNIRGDAAYVLGVIKDTAAIPYLEAAADEENPAVREVIQDALEQIRKVP